MSLRNAHKGASTDAGAHSQVDYRNLNFLDSAWILSSAFKLEQKRQSLGGDLQFPPTETGFRDSLNALIERTDIEGEVAEKLSLGAKRSIVSGKMEHAFGVRYLVENQGIAPRLPRLIPGRYAMSIICFIRRAAFW